MVQATRETNVGPIDLHYSFDLLVRWLNWWGRQFPNGTPLSHRKLIMALNRNGNHWVCIVIDSFKLQHHLAWLHDSAWFWGRWIDRTGPSLHPNEHQRAYHCPDDCRWTSVGSTRETMPQQINSDDCGIYTYMAADCTMQHLLFSFTPEQVQGARVRIALAIIQSRAPTWWSTADHTRPPHRRKCNAFIGSRSFFRYM